MGLFDRTASRMAGRATLLLTADPGQALLDAARRYDPEVRPWLGRLVFHNGVLLFGPVTVTPKVEQRAGLPPGMALAWYTGAAQQTSREQRPHEDKVADGDRLVRGLAVRLGGTTRPAPLQPELSLMASVFSEQGLDPEQVAEVVRQFGGEPRVDDPDALSYTIRGKGTHFNVGYLSPQVFIPRSSPAALGKLRSGRLHEWDLITAIRASRASRELCLVVGGAALALASRAGGIVTDELGFRVDQPEDMLLR